MAFDGAMKAMGSKKPKMAESKPKPKPQPAVSGENQESAPEVAPEGGGGEATSITHNPDGSHTMDGETHPSHLHLMAALGHKLTGDKHHVAHHDGTAIHTHGITEMGEHQEGGSHNSAEEAKQALGKFFDEEAGEPDHQEQQPAGMGEYGG